MIREQKIKIFSIYQSSQKLLMLFYLLFWDPISSQFAQFIAQRGLPSIQQLNFSNLLHQDNLCILDQFHQILFYNLLLYPFHRVFNSPYQEILESQQFHYHLYHRGLKFGRIHFFLDDTHYILILPSINLEVLKIHPHHNQKHQKPLSIPSHLAQIQDALRTLWPQTRSFLSETLSHLNLLFKQFRCQIQLTDSIKTTIFLRAII